MPPASDPRTGSESGRQPPHPPLLAGAWYDARVARTPEPFAILLDTPHVLCVAKSAGVPVLGERWNPDAPTLLDLVRARVSPEIDPVHRLDRETSGVTLFARTKDAARLLSEAFATGGIEKRYLAIVEGVPEPAEGEIDAPLLEVGGNRSRVDERHGKPSLTRYRVAEVLGGFSVLDVWPKTGRTHQIRVHLAHRGTPLAVDPVYGGRKAIYLSELKRRGYHAPPEGERPLLARLSLHAAHIRFPDPGGGPPLEAEAEIPKDLKAFLNQLRKLF